MRAILITVAVTAFLSIVGTLTIFGPMLRSIGQQAALNERAAELAADELVLLETQRIAYLQQIAEGPVPALRSFRAEDIGRVSGDDIAGYQRDQSTLAFMQVSYPDCEIVSFGYGSHVRTKQGGAEMVYFIKSPLCPNDQSGRWGGPSES